MHLPHTEELKDLKDRIRYVLLAAAGHPVHPMTNALHASFHAHKLSLGQKQEIVQETANLVKRKELMEKEVKVGLNASEGDGIALQLNGRTYGTAVEATISHATETRRALGSHVEVKVPTHSPSRCSTWPL